VQKLHGVVAAIRLDDLDGFRLASLVGASLVYCDEAPRGRFNEQLVKSLIGGETVPVNRKYLSTVSLRLQGKWVVLGNHVPTITDHSTGFWRRWDLVPFGNTLPESERDPMLLNKIMLTDMPAILNWALTGLRRLLARGNFDPKQPTPMATLLNSARIDSNSIQAWLQDVDLRLAPGGASVSRKTQLYGHYRAWCEDNGLQAFSSMKWYQFLDAHYPNRLILKRQRGVGDKNPDWFINLIYEDSDLCVTADLAFND
jgi:putative DNA primase/helicase